MQEISMKVMPKTVYTDIVTLPDPMLLGITIHYYNHSDDTLYMKIFGSGPIPWSSNAVELGSLGSGLNTYVHLDNFLSRTKPSAETTEVLTLTLRGYSDAGYSQLVYEFQRTCTVIMIKSDDGSWTQDVLNNFDDGTVQGWSILKEAGDNYYGPPTLSVATDYILSAPYSLKGYYAVLNMPIRIRVYKSFTLPNKTQIYAIFNVRASSSATDGYIKYLKFSYYYSDVETTLIFLGKDEDIGGTGNNIPKNKWMRIVVPLPANITAELRVILKGFKVTSGGRDLILWLDDFKIISK